MKKLCVLNKLWILLAAALFSLTLAAPESSAQQIMIGAGVDDPCYDGSATTPLTSNGGSWCGILGASPGSVNVILDNSFNWYQNTTNNTDIVSDLIMVFAIPVQNLLQPFDDLFAGDQSNIFNPLLTSNPIIDQHGGAGVQAEFVSHNDLPCWYDCSAVLGDGPWVDVSFPDPVLETYTDPPFADAFNVPLGWGGAGFTQGTIFKLGAAGHDGALAVGNTDIYEFLGLPVCTGGNIFCGPQSNSITNWTMGTLEIPAAVLGVEATSPPFVTPTEGWRVYMVTIDEKNLVDQKDAIHFFFDEAKLPLGTWVAAWAVGATQCDDNDENCDPNYFSMSFTESAFLMPLPEFQVPEPTSLLLLGAGLAMVGFSRRRGGKRS